MKYKKHLRTLDKDQANQKHFILISYEIFLKVQFNINYKEIIVFPKYIY